MDNSSSSGKADVTIPLNGSGVTKNDLVLYGRPSTMRIASRSSLNTMTKRGTASDSALQNMVTSSPHASSANLFSSNTTIAPNKVRVRKTTNGKAIAEACRHNAELAMKTKNEPIGHIWSMLAACFELMVMTSVAQTYDKIESVRVKARCGLGKTWTEHPLGQPLLRQIFVHLGSIGDLQTVATIICTLGGAVIVAQLLDDPTLHTASSLDRILLR